MDRRKVTPRWEVWLNAYAHLGGDQLLATHRWKWIANLHAGLALQSFQGHVYAVTVKDRDRVEHTLTFEDKNGGVRYQCSCGWSQGWVAGTRKDAERINRAAHAVTRAAALAILNEERE